MAGRLYRIGVCSQCGKETYIQNKWLNLCCKCVYKKNHEGKEVSHQKVYTRKNTGEKQLFQEIWNERPHYCVNCGKFLGHEARSHYFSHIVAKSVDESKRLDKSNIQLLCWDCHDALDKQSKEHYERRRNLYK